MQRERVGDLEKRGVLAIGDGYRAKRSELADEGLPFGRAANINDGFHFDGAEKLGLPGVERAGDKVSRPGDVVFTSKGTVGRFALVAEDTETFAYSPQLCYWRSLDPSVLLPRYLYYWMNGPGFFAQVAAVKGQTDMAEYVNLRDQRMMRVPIPSLGEQERIANVLGALDDKIEANRQVSDTLDALAQVVFRERFGRYRPDSELPDGWAVKPVGDILDAVGGSTPSTKEPLYWEGGTIRWTSPKDLSSARSPVLLDTSRRITEAGLAKISSGLLPVDTVLLSSRAPVGYLAIARVPVAINQGYIAIPPGSHFTPHFLYYWLHDHLPEIKSRAGGTTFPEISKRSFRSLRSVVPPSEEVNRFEDFARPLVRRIEANDVQSETLAVLRDRLIPALLSGSVSVADAVGEFGVAV